MRCAHRLPARWSHGDNHTDGNGDAIGATNSDRNADHHGEDAAVTDRELHAEFDTVADADTHTNTDANPVPAADSDADAPAGLPGCQYLLQDLYGGKGVRRLVHRHGLDVPGWAAVRV